MDLKGKKKSPRFQFTVIFLSCASPCYLFTERASVWQIPLGVLPFPHDEWNVLSLAFVYQKPTKYKWNSPSTRRELWAAVKASSAGSVAAWHPHLHRRVREAGRTTSRHFLLFVFSAWTFSALFPTHHLWAVGLFLSCPKQWPWATGHYRAPAVCPFRTAMCASVKCTLHFWALVWKNAMLNKPLIFLLITCWNDVLNVLAK